MLHPDIPGDKGPTPPPRLLAGKYRDVDALENGYQELQRISNETYQKYQSLSSRLEELERMNPADRATTRRNPLEVLEEVGVPGEPVAELVREELQKFMQPILAAQEARQTVYREIPQFQEREQKVVDFLEGNPNLKSRYQRMYQVDPAGAMEWAYAMESRFSGEHQQQLEDGRQDRGLPPSSAGQNRSADSMLGDEEMERLIDHARRTGDWTKVIQARMNIPSSHFTPYGY